MPTLPLLHIITTPEVREAASQTGRALQYPLKQPRAISEEPELRISDQGMGSQGTWLVGSSLEDYWRNFNK